MLNRKERRAIAQGRGFNESRWYYRPNHVYTGVDGDIMMAFREADVNLSIARFDELWADVIPDHPISYGGSE